jgi:hypothetical protein
VEEDDAMARFGVLQDSFAKEKMEGLLCSMFAVSRRIDACIYRRGWRDE